MTLKKADRDLPCGGDLAGFKKRFFDRLSGLPETFSIFEYIPDIMFFMKDDKGHITAGSPNFVRLMGGTVEEDILGCDAFDLCTQTLAEQYTEDDQRVMQSGKPLENHLELNQGPDAEPGWFITHKIPLYDKDGVVMGIAGITRNVSESRLLLQPFDVFSRAIEYIQDHLDEKIEIPELARLTHLSLNHFERKFKKLFGIPPSKYIVQVRVHRAARLLVETSGTICEIAQEVGFYDQSALTRYFVKVIGTTPSAYRKSAGA